MYGRRGAGRMIALDNRAELTTFTCGDVDKGALAAEPIYNRGQKHISFDSVVIGYVRHLQASGRRRQSRYLVGTC